MMAGTLQRTAAGRRLRRAREFVPEVKTCGARGRHKVFLLADVNIGHYEGAYDHGAIRLADVNIGHYEARQIGSGGSASGDAGFFLGVVLGRVKLWLARRQLYGRRGAEAASGRVS